MDSPQLELPFSESLSPTLEQVARRGAREINSFSGRASRKLTQDELEQSPDYRLQIYAKAYEEYTSLVSENGLSSWRAMELIRKKYILPAGISPVQLRTARGLLGASLARWKKDQKEEEELEGPSPPSIDNCLPFSLLNSKG